MKTRNPIWCAAAVLAAAGGAFAGDKSWNMVGGGAWNTGTNWISNGVPGVADNVFLGNTAAASNSTVNLNVNSSIASMTITDGMYLSTQNSRLIVIGDTSVSGENLQNNVLYRSSLQVRNGPNFASDYVTRNLTVSDNGWVSLWDGAGLEVQGLLWIDSDALVQGEGTIKLTSNNAVAMRVDGYLQPGTGGLTINQEGTGRIDLDGSVFDPDAVINVSGYMGDLSAFSHLTINGDQLTDTFDEGIWITEGGYVTMNLTNGWAMGPLSELKFFGIQNYESSANLNGNSELSFAGSIELVGTGTWAQMNTFLTLQPSADVLIGDQDLLEFKLPTTIEGGTYTVEAGTGQMQFDGAATIHGGTFNSEETFAEHAPFQFKGFTTWDGSVQINGEAQEDGTANVVGPTTINAYTFDMDGFSGDAMWMVSDQLTVNAGSIDVTNNQFDGGMVVSGPAAARATINVSANQEWLTTGVMTLSEGFQVLTTRLAGSPCRIWGALYVTGQVRSTAEMRFNHTSTTSFSNAQTLLQVANHMHIYDGATFNGLGTLRGSSQKDILLDDGSDLGEIMLINDGNLRIDNGIGEAHLGRFQQTAGGNWDVQINGDGPGTLNDYMLVTSGTATLGGTVNVDLGNFIPIIGNTFKILVARGGVNGTFANNPVTHTNSGLIVEWSYVYTATEVFLRVDHITSRCPADFNQDGVVDFFDYLDFVDEFSADSMAADFNHDGVIDFFDYLDFVDAFSAGC